MATRKAELIENIVSDENIINKTIKKWHLEDKDAEDVKMLVEFLADAWADGYVAGLEAGIEIFNDIIEKADLEEDITNFILKEVDNESA